jgi:hypothetical protein
LFPTTIRNTAIGSCSTVARIGAILALLIGLLVTISTKISKATKKVQKSRLFYLYHENKQRTLST